MLRALLQRNRPARARRVALHAEWLEPRLLYSADAGALLAATTDTQLDAPETRTLGTGNEYTTQAAATPTTEAVRAAYALTPLQFEANAGQLGEGVDFAASGLGYAVRLGGGQAELLLDGADAPVRLELVGAGAGTAAGENPLATRSNYLVGAQDQWVTDIANYGSVLYADVYQGIDVRYYGNQNQLEYDFLVGPGADATQLQLRFHGVDDVRLDANGDLVLRVAGTGREIRFQAPVSYQEGPDGREAVESHYAIDADGTVRIVVGAYDTTRALVVDPVLAHASYFGEGGAETALGVAVGADGSVYVTGHTTSTTGTFATRVAGGSDGSDTYVAKFNADLTSLLYVTRVGGSSTEQGTSIAVDAAGNAIVTGWTKSTDLAGVTAASDQAARSGTQDAFVYKLNASGTALVFSTYFGGGGNTDIGAGVTVDAAGNVYAAGTASAVTSGTGDDAFLNKYSASGTALTKLRYGGSGNDGAAGVALDAAGNVYIAGNTLSSDLAIVGGAQTTRPSPSAEDGFLVKYTAAGSIAYSTYIGGPKADTVAGVAANDGLAYVIGRTKDPSQGFATTTGAFATVAYTHETGFLRIYDTAQTGAASMTYSSFIGGGSTSGTLNDAPTGIAVDSGGRVAIVGWTDTANFPTTAGAFDSTNTDGSVAGFLIVLDPESSGSGDLVYGTYYGFGLASGAAAWGNGRAYIVGSVTVNGLATSDGFAPTYNSAGDGIVAAFGSFPNRAPVLGGAADLPAQPEDAAAGGGTLVADLVAGQVSDADTGALGGIAITAADNANGTWQYTLDGTNWTTFSTPASGNALLLGSDATTRVRFVANADYNGGSSIAFRAWDQTSGTAGSTVAVGTAGGTSAFSVATATSSVVVTPVNDAPVLAGASNLPAQAEDAAAGSGTLVSALVAGKVSDVDAGALAGIAVTVAAGGGTWQYSLDGTTWTTFATPAAGNALLLAADATTRVRFVSAADFNGNSSITFHAWDRSAGTAGTVAPLGSSGGGSAFSSATATASVTVTPVNDAPVLAGANPLPAILEDSVAGAGVLVSTLLAGQASDADAGALSGIAITAAASGGTWQYALNGTTWVTFTTPAAGNALLLAADATTRVRFVPSANFAGDSSLGFQAWDRTSGTAGTVVALGSTGGTSAFSSAGATATITVTGVNDAPIVVGTPTTTLTFTESATPVSLAAAGFNFAAGGGSDETSQAISIVVTRLPTNAGTLQLADGTAVVLGGTYTLAELQAMRIQLRAPGDAFMFDVKDGGGTANGGQDTLASQVVSIAVSNVAPVLNGSNAITQVEDAPGNGTLVSDLLAGQVNDPGGAYGIAVTGVPNTNTANGVWEYSLDGGTSWTALSGSNNNSRLLGPTARVRFVSDAGENINGAIPGFTYRAWDGSSGAVNDTVSTNTNGGTTAFSTAVMTASLFVTPVNDAPIRYDIVAGTFLPAPANLTVNEGAAITSLGLGYLAYVGEPSVAEYNQQLLTYTVSAVPTGIGTVVLADGVTAVMAGTSYSLAQVQGMKFIAAAGVQNASGTFSWNVTDNGGTAGGGIDTLAEAITITVRNVAPTLSGTNNLAPILEDQPGTGTKVADLIAGKAFDGGGSLGIAVTGANGANGTWQYTRDGGTSWSAITGVSDTGALLLAANDLTRVRFVPNANFNGTVTGLAFRAWDGSSGTAGGTANASVNGGTTAFSTTTATASITVGGVNDVPVRTAGALNPLILLDGSPPTSLGLAGVAFAPGGGTDEAGQTLTYTVTALPSSLGTIVLANGTTVVTANTAYTLAQIQGMQFKSSGVGALGTATFSFEVKDSGGTLNGGVDTLVQSVTIIVNRAPVLNGANSTLTVFEDFDWSGGVPQGNPPPWASGAQRAGLLVSDIVSGQIVDTAGSLAGIAIHARTGTGSWQYSQDGGTTWTNIPAVSDSASLLLASNSLTRVRFLPGPDFNSSIGPASISFRAWDQTTGASGSTADTSWNGGASAYSAMAATATIAVTAVNDAPVRTAGTVAPMSAVEGGASVSLGLGDIAYAPGRATATDETAQTLAYRVTALPTALGTITLADGTTVVTANTVYTLAQIQGMRFQPTPGVMPGAGSFSFTVRDNGGNANGGADTLTQTVGITVTNLAPVLAGANAMTGILEDTPDNGTLVADLVAGRITDVTSARGIAITGADTANGSWEFTTDGGTTWIALGAPTASTARLLAADTLTRVRFVPAADWNGTATLTLAAWDRSSGTAGGTADASAGGGSLAFSTQTATTGIVVGAVNDRPVHTGGAVANLVVAEDSGTTSLSLAGLNYGPGGGADEAAQNLAYTVAALPPSALGAITLADGTAVTAGTGYTLAQLQGMVFVAAAHANGSGSFAFTVKDDGGGDDTLVQTLAITVTAVNDVPVRTAGSVADLAIVEDSGITSLGLGAIAYGPGGGTDEASQGLSYTVTTLPPATLGRILLADGTAATAGSYTLAQLQGMRFEAVPDANGVATFAFSVVDTGGGTDTLVESLSITVSAANDPPVRTGGSVADLVVAEDSGSTGLGLATLAYGPGGGSDEAGQVLAYMVTALPPSSLGRITLADGTAVTAGSYTLAQIQGMRFVAAPDGFGTGSFAWSVADGGGGSDTLPQSLQITVAAVDDPTAAAADTATAPEDGVASGNVLANDSDVDTLLQVTGFAIGGTSYAVGSTAAIAGIGSFTLAAGGAFGFTPLADWNGSVPQVTYTTNTGASSTLDIAITAVDDPTVVTADTQRVAEDTPAAGNVLANDTDVDDALSVVSFQVAGDATVHAAGATVAIAGVGTLTLAASGAYTFTPLANWNGGVPVVSYTTSTGAGSTLTIDVTPVDTVTTAVADSVTVPEDTPATGNVLANDTDADDVLAVAIFQVAGDATVHAAGASVTVAGQGTFTLASSGSFTFTPLANWNGSLPVVSYTTNTGATSTLAVTVTPVDDASQLVADTRTIAEDGAAAGNVLANDVDIDDTLQVTGFSIGGTGYAAGATATLAGIGSFTLAADGTYGFTPLANWNGSVPQVTYTTGTGVSSTLAISVTAQDDPSVLVADSATVPEEGVATGNVLANDSDVDSTLAVAGFQLAGDPATHAAGSSVTIAGQGTFTLAANGSFSFTPVANWNGSVPQVSYTTNTGATATLQVTVTPVDDPSVLVADTASAAEDNVATGDVLANDSDVETVLQVAGFSIAGTSYAPGATATLAGIGSFTLAGNGSYAFTPLANWNGSVPQVTYSTNTGASSTLAIAVAAQDDPTQVAADSLTVTEDAVAAGNVLANDSDVDDTLTVASFRLAGDPASYAAGSSVTIAGRGTFTLAADGGFSFTPLADWSGSVPQVSYTTGTGATGTLAITVTAVDDPTVAVNDSASVAEEGTATGNVLANDSDAETPLAVSGFQVAGDGLSYAAGATAVIAGQGSITLAADGSFSFTPLADWNGSVPVVTYTTNTGASAALSILVTPVDDPSVLAADGLTVDEDTVAAGNLLANDDDIDSTLVVDHFQVAGDTDVYAAGVTATIAGVGSIRVDADGAFVFTPAADWNGSVPLLTYATNTGSSSTLALVLTPVDDPSVVVADTASVAEDNGAAGNVLANDSDVDDTLAVTGFRVAGDATTYAAGATATIAGIGTLTLAANGAYVFTPLASWNGSVPLASYELNTGAVGTLAISVTPVDDATVATTDDTTVVEDGVATGNVLANDTDVDSVLAVRDFQVNGDATVYAAGATATIVGTGTFTLGADGSFTFTPATDWNGAVPVVSYTTNTAVTSTLAITVTPADDPTQAAADSVTVAEDSVATGNVLANDLDIDSIVSVASFQVAGDPATYVAGTTAVIAGVGSITIGADGSYSFTPVADWNGSVPLVSYATDTGASSTLEIVVTPTADPTMVVADNVAAPEDTIATGNVLANDSDPDQPLAVTSFQVAGDIATYTAGSSATIAGVGTLTLNADGSFSFSPAADWNGTVPVVSYTTSTGVGSTLAITVTPVAEPTVTVADSVTVAEESAATGNVLANDSDADGPFSVASFQLAGDTTVYAAGSSVVLAGRGTFTVAADGSFTFTPVANWNGIVPVVSYTTDTAAVGTLTITVTPVDDPTQVTADTATIAEDGLGSGNVLANDSDVDAPLAVANFQVAGDSTLHSAGTTVVLAGQGSITIAADGSFTFTPLANWNGIVPVVSYTTDTGATGTLAITVTAVDDPTQVSADSGSANEDTAATGNVLPNDSDADDTLAVATFQVAGDATVYTAGQAATIAGIGSFTLGADGAYTFTPADHWNGNVPLVSYTTNTGASSTLAIAIAAQDDASVLVADSIGVAEDTPATGNVLANDADVDDTLAVVAFRVAGDATVYAAGQTAVIAGIGSVTLGANGACSFTPVANWNGTVPQLSYSTNTGAASTLAITVAPVDDASQLTADTNTIAEDGVAGGNVLANDGDVDDTLQVAGFSILGTSHAAGATAALAGIGSFTLAANGAYTFTPAADWNGAVPQVTYTTNTGAASTLAIMVTAVDDATAMNAEVVTVAEDTPVAGNVLANDTDVETTLQVASFTLGGNSYTAGSTVTVAGVGSFSLAANGSYSFAPVANWNGTLPQVAYTTNTGASSTLDIGVTPVDDATVMNPEAVNVAEDTVAAGNVLANDSDVETVLQVTGFTIAGTSYGAGSTAVLGGVGTFTLAANGAYVFTPAANWNGAVPQVAYATNTGAGSTLDITVAPVDDASVTNPEAVSVAEDTVATGNVLANDSDAETALQVTSFTVNGSTYAAGTTAALAGIGSFTLGADGAYSFTPAADWNGIVPQVAYLTNTGAASTLDITVTPVDDASAMNPESVTVAEDGAATGNVLANDSDVESALQVASFTLAGATHAAGTTVAIAGVGSFSLAANGDYVFTPASNWNGAVPQVAYATNTGAASTLDITVTPVDDATVMNPETVTVAEDTAAAGNVLANDRDVETALQVVSFTIAGSSHAAGSTVAVAGGSFTLGADGSYAFTPAANWNGTVPQVAYTTNTGATSTLDIGVAPVDDATVMNLETVTVAEDTVATGNVLANDSDVETPLQVTSFTIAGTSYAAGSTVALLGVGSFTLGAGGAYVFTPAANWNGAVPQVAYTTNTGAASTLDIGVTPVDDATAMNPEAVAIVEDMVATGNVLTNDSDVETPLQVTSFTLAGATYAAGSTVALAGIGSFTLGANGAYTFTPIANWNGALPQVAYTTNTGAASTLDISVTPVDDATAMNPETVTVAEDTVAVGNVLANDSDVETALQVASFTVAGTSYAAGSTVAIAGVGNFMLAANGAYTFTPSVNWSGTLPQVAYTTNTGASSTLDITVTPVDDASVMNPEMVTMAEDTVAAGNALANDGDVETALQVAGFIIAGNTYAAGSTVAIAGVGSFTLAASGDYSFTPAADWNGSVPQVAYTTNTGAASTLAITVTAVDDPTTMTPESVTVAEDTAVAGNVLTNDSDVETPLQVASFTLEGTSYAAGSTVVVAGAGSFRLGADGAYSFEPVANWNGTLPQVAYTTNTGSASTLAITLVPVDDATVANPDAVSVPEDGVAAGNVLVNDVDADSALQVASFTIAGATYAAGSTVAIAGVGSFTLAADGSYGFTPVANWNGTPPQVAYTTNSGGGSILEITVTPVDDASAMNPEAVSVPEDTVASGNVLANDSDIDTPLQVASFTIGGTRYAAGSTVAVAGAGSFTLAADGNYAFIPAANWNGTLPQVAYTTNTGAASTLAITVTPVDDATATNPDTLTLAEDTAGTGNVLANDGDVDTVLRVAGFTVNGSSYAAGSTATLVGIGSFTLGADGAYSFTPVANWNGTLPQVAYTTNTGAASTLDIAVSPVDDAPMRTSAAPANVAVTEGSGATSLGLGGLGYTAGGGADETAQALVYTITSLPASIGRVVLADGVTTVVAGASYTLAQLQGMQFIPAAVSSGAGGFAFSVSDGSGAAPLEERITVSVVNQAPVLAGSNILPVLREDSADAGMLVADLIAGQASDPLGRYGIAVVDAASNAGRWQFSRDGGQTWLEFAGLSAADAELLPADALARVRFVPNADWNGDAGGLQFRAWDQSDASGARRGDTTVNGGSSAFSTAVAGATIHVDAVNDAPSTLASGPGLVGVEPSGLAQFGSWSYAPGGGGDEATQSLTVTITAMPPSSLGTLTLADGITPVRLGTGYSLQEFQGLRFVPAAGAEGAAAQVAWVVSDDGGTANGGADRAAGAVTIVVQSQAPQDGPALAPTTPVPPPQNLVVAPAPVTAPVAPAAPAAAAAPFTGRIAVNPFAPAPDAFGEAPTREATGFAPQFMTLVQDAGQGGLDGRETRLVPVSFGAGDFLVTGFAGVETATRISVEDFQQALRSGVFIEELNRLRRELNEEFDLDRSTTITVAGLSLGLSVVYILWLVRGGVLLGSYLSALPAWRLLDPLPVLAKPGEDEEEEDDDAFDPRRGRGPDPLRGFA